MKDNRLFPDRQLRYGLTCVPAVMLAMLAAIAMVIALTPVAEHRVYAADAPGSAKDETLAHGNLTSGGRPPMVFKLEPSAPDSEWKAVQQVLNRREKIQLTVWYDFGSLHLQGAPEKGHYRIDMTLEWELTENEKASMFTCIIDGQYFDILDLVRDGDQARNAPPKRLPEPLKTLCCDRPQG